MSRLKHNGIMSRNNTSEFIPNFKHEICLICSQFGCISGMSRYDTHNHDHCHEQVWTKNQANLSWMLSYQITVLSIVHLAMSDSKFSNRNVGCWPTMWLQGCRDLHVHHWNFRRFSMIFDNIITVISILCQQLVIILTSCLGFVSHSDTIRYFPRNQTNQLFLEDIIY